VRAAALALRLELKERHSALSYDCTRGSKPGRTTLGRLLVSFSFQNDERWRIWQFDPQLNLGLVSQIAGPAFSLVMPSSLDGFRSKWGTMRTSRAAGTYTISAAEGSICMFVRMWPRLEIRQRQSSGKAVHANRNTRGIKPKVNYFHLLSSKMLQNNLLN